MPRPPSTPIGLRLTQVSKLVSQEFDRALAQAGGSLPVWLVLIGLKSGQLPSQRELAESVGIRGPTLTYHLNAMETAGLVTRRRDPANRRVHVVELTDEGEALFARMRDTAATFDRRLRAGLTEQDIVRLDVLLRQLADSVSRASC